MITVKIVQIGSSIDEVALETGATVGAALAATRLSIPESYSVTVNGATVTSSHVLNNGDTLMIGKGAKGAL